MKPLFAICIGLIFVGPAPAHFVWLVPQQGGKAQLIFSDSLKPDANVPVTKIAQTELFAHAPDTAGFFEFEKHAAQKDHYPITFKQFGIQGLELGGICRYGVYGKKGEPALIYYYPKTSLGTPVTRDVTGKGWDKLPLQIIPVKAGNYRVLWQGKPVQDVEVVALVPGATEDRELKLKEDGSFDLGIIPAVAGLVGLRARYIEPKAGELDGKQYKEIRHYATWTFYLSADKGKVVPAEAKADPAATKLLTDARAARAVWHNFPGFHADLDVNVNGVVSKGKVDVDAAGKVKLMLEADDELKAWARREIASLVGHRLPGVAYDTPCVFVDQVEHHPSGRALRVLSDELHSSYRIRDRQILEVNREMKDIRFTITVLEDLMNQDKQYLPVSFVVNTWELKAKTLVSSAVHHQTWNRIGAFDLPGSLRVVHAKAGQLDDRQLTFSKVQLAGGK